MDNRGRLPEAQILKHFPFPEVRHGQSQMAEFLGKHNQATIESPTGSGKSAVEYALLKAVESVGIGPRNIIVPTKAIADQFKTAYPDLEVVYGRGENPCYYYEEKKETLSPENAQFKADEIPCSILQNCPHRVNLETGETHEPGATPCPYLLAKHKSRQSKGIILSTFAYHVFNNLFVPKEGDEDGVLVVDEVHRLPEVLRNVLSSEITDYHLYRSAEILERVEGEEEAKALRSFAKALISMVMRRQPRGEPLLKEDEIGKLLDLLEAIDYQKLKKLLRNAVTQGIVDPKEDRETLKRLESIVRDVKRYVNTFRYSLPGKSRNPLNYIYAACEGSKEEVEEAGKKVRCKLVVKCHHVAPLIKKMFRRFTAVFSATIGNPQTFAFESGIEFPFVSIPSDFPVTNTAIYSPVDTPDLSHKKCPHGEPNKTFRRIARATLEFKKKGHRSLVIVVSEAERLKFEQLAREEGVDVLTYSEGFKPKDVAQAFKDGVGDVLLGTEAHFGEGIDLPDGVCPVTFVLRPAYPSPADPGAKFEERRFGCGGVWGVRQHRVVIRALQARGRNVRSAKDRGVTFFISQQFKGFVRHNLPAWLQDAYFGKLKFDECMEHAFGVLGKK